ncbi:MAG: GtrA family protein [Rikenellaceae bacterium]
MKRIITKIVDFFYLPFIRKFIPIQTFRYAVCGGVNLVLDALLYHLIFKFILNSENLHLGFITISPQIAAYLITMPIVLVTGFWLSRNISFQDREGEKRAQQLKYIAVVGLNIAVKYFGLKFLTLILHLFPSLANIVMTVVTVVVSYLLQNNFTFKKQ